MGKTQSFAHISTQKNTTSPQSLLKTTLQSKSTHTHKKKVTRNFEFMARLLKFKLLNVFVMRLEALDFIMHPQLHFLSSWILLRQHYTLDTHSNTYAHQRKEMWHLKRATACKKRSAGEWRNNVTLPRSIVSRLKREEQSRHLFRLNNAAFGQSRNLEEGNCAYHDNAIAATKSLQLMAEQSRGGG